MKIIYRILKIINHIIPKNKNKLYIRPLANCKSDQYDLINYTADTALSFLNYILDADCTRDYTIVLEIYHPERLEEYIKYVSNKTNFKFLTSSKCYSSFSKFVITIRNVFIKLTCCCWISESVPEIKSYATKKQKQVILGYATSCKSDCIYNKKSAAELRRFSNKNNAIVFSTSFLDSIMKSSAYGVPMECFLPIGMARNDLLGNGIISQKAKEWMDKKKFSKDTKVILYAPTFRDYESITDVQSRSIWGADYDDRLLCDYLRKNNIIVIAKLHSWQNKNAILLDNESVILYEPTFDFSFYDLFKLADIMITDYSSIGLDWLFMNKPLIYNLWDYELYQKERGFAYEPYEDLCGGEIVKNTNELITAIQTALEIDLYSEKRARIKNVMYSVQDYSSSEKAYNLLLSFLNDGSK